MKYAILSDVHGNLEAFQSVVKEIEKESPDRILFLGDIVGYGANPNRSIDLLKKITDIAVAGNHDHAALGLTDIASFNPYAREAILWTRAHLTPDHIQYLKGLPFSREIEDMTLIHSSPREPEEWHYIFGAGDIEDNFDYFNTQICFIGHTHIPLVIVQDKRGEIGISRENPITIKKGFRYVINVGSVGQSRDGDNRAAYALCNTAKHSFELKRTAYDIQTAKEKIVREGLPRYLADRLEYGR